MPKKKKVGRPPKKRSRKEKVDKVMDLVNQAREDLLELKSDLEFDLEAIEFMIQGLDDADWHSTDLKRKGKNETT